MINHVNKVWGSEDWLINNSMYCAKFLNLNYGYECSVHYHAIKDETFYILAGQVELYIVDLRTLINPLPFLPLLQDEEPKNYHQMILPKKDSILNKLDKIILNNGDQYRLSPFVAHKFRSSTSGAKILEVSTTHFEEDSYRLTEANRWNK